MVVGVQYTNMVIFHYYSIFTCIDILCVSVETRKPNAPCGDDGMMVYMQIAQSFIAHLRISLHMIHRRYSLRIVCCQCQ